jgi:hypothetical protein
VVTSKHLIFNISRNSEIIDLKEVLELELKPVE